MKWHNIVLVSVILMLGACVIPEKESNNSSTEPHGSRSGVLEYGGGSGKSFKVPLPAGYNWEVTQSWAEHCEVCNERGYDEAYEGFFGNFCELSHSIYPSCRYAWDFNLPGNADRGKAVLASEDGVVEDISVDEYNGGWGDTVRIDHGDGICTRYSHLLEDSIAVYEGQAVCQGLKIAEIGGTPEGMSYHLHFQFEECDTKEPLPMGFTDGNGIPVCTMGADVFDENGNYSFLRLTNEQVEDCAEGASSFDGEELPEGGWLWGGCGTLPGCPLIPNCGRGANHEFSDQDELDSAVAEAAAYLWSECALDGKSDGGIHPHEKITRAEALKIPLFLFGLMEDCGASEPFNDVDQDDWYFGVVACAVKNGIVNTIASYFLPNDWVNFAEAAKFLVESASRAGVIQIKNPSTGHFSHIPSSHWAYRYVETLYAYGGLASNAVNYEPHQQISRREYIVMAASLSPCFCGNVSCRSGCVCDQEVFACIDLDDDTPGTGGESGDDSGDDNGDEFEEPTEKEFDLEIQCWADLDNTRCEDPYTILFIKCAVSNDGEEVVRINDLVMSMTQSADTETCQLTDPHLHQGAGTQNVDPGEERVLNGHYEFSCTSAPQDYEISVSFDLVEKTAGVRTWYYHLLETDITVPSGPFSDCDLQFPCTPDCAGKECGPDYCGGFCGSCAAGRTCDYDSGQCICAANGCGWECGDCPASQICQAGQCVCMPNCDGRQCGSDDCGGSCGVCPAGSVCENSQCQEDPCIYCPINAECIDGQCMIDEWACDPDVGYRMLLSSPGGSFNIITSGPIPSYDGAFPPGMDMQVTFACVDLPSAILISGGLDGIQVSLVDEGLPAFAVWTLYFGELTLNPPYNPDVVVYGFNTDAQNTSILIRIPAN